MVKEKKFSLDGRWVIPVITILTVLCLIGLYGYLSLKVDYNQLNSQYVRSQQDAQRQKDMVSTLQQGFYEAQLNLTHTMAGFDCYKPGTIYFGV